MKILTTNLVLESAPGRDFHRKNAEVNRNSKGSGELQAANCCCNSRLVVDDDVLDDYYILVNQCHGLNMLKG